MHDSTTGTYTPSISSTVGIATCPLVATCEIYVDSGDYWAGCNTAPFDRFYNSFSTTNGAYVVLYTTSYYTADWTAPYDIQTYQVRITFEDD